MRTLTFLTVLDWFFWLAAVIISTWIVAKSVHSYRADKEKKRRIIAKASVALAIWLVLSFITRVCLGLYSWSAIHTVEYNPPIKLEEATMWVVGVLLVYVLVGYGLIYLASRGGRLKLR